MKTQRLQGLLRVALTLLALSALTSCVYTQTRGESRDAPFVVDNGASLQLQHNTTWFVAVAVDINAVGPSTELLRNLRLPRQPSVGQVVRTVVPNASLRETKSVAGVNSQLQGLFLERTVTDIDKDTVYFKDNARALLAFSVGDTTGTHGWAGVVNNAPVELKLELTAP